MDKTIKELAKMADRLTDIIHSRTKALKKEEKIKLEVARDIMNRILAEKIINNSKEAKT